VRRVCVDGLTYYQFERLASRADAVHGVFTRQGGVSGPPWGIAQSQRSTGDSPEAVSQNNRRMLAVLGLVQGQTGECVAESRNPDRRRRPGSTWAQRCARRMR